MMCRMPTTRTTIDTRLDLFGDRQSGKTTALLKIALFDAARGDRIHFWCHYLRDLTEAFRTARNLVETSTRVERVDLALGSEAIHFVGGGRVVFLCGARGDGRGFPNPDFDVFDGCNFRVDPPVADRSIRNVNR